MDQYIYQQRHFESIEPPYWTYHKSIYFTSKLQDYIFWFYHVTKLNKSDLIMKYLSTCAS